MICVSLRVNFVLKSTTLLLLCSYHVLKWELFILDSIILFLCFARSKFCSKISRFSMGIALTLARTARLTLYGTFFTIYCNSNEDILYVDDTLVCTTTHHTQLVHFAFCPSLRCVLLVYFCFFLNFSLFFCFV